MSRAALLWLLIGGGVAVFVASEFLRGRRWVPSRASFWLTLLGPVLAIGCVVTAALLLWMWGVQRG